MTHLCHLASILTLPANLAWGLPQPTQTRRPTREGFLLSASKESQGLFSSLLREGTQRTSPKKGENKVRNSASEMQAQSTELSMLATHGEERAVVRKIQNSG